MQEQDQPIYIVFSPETAEEFSVEGLNELTREFGRALEGEPEFVKSISYAGREALPQGTKTPELVFAHQVVLALIPLVTPWVLDKADKFVKTARDTGARVSAKIQIGNREVQVTPKTTPAEMTKIKHQVKSMEKLAPSKRYALVIGNAEYEDEQLAWLASPIVDAERLAEALSNPGIGAFDEVSTLMNEDSVAIKTSIERFFSNRERDDLVLLYFSGHGLRNEAGQLFLAARNLRRGLIRSTGVAASFIKDIMDSSFSQRQILILDCCFGGAMLEGAKSEQIVGQPAHSALAFQTSGFGRIIITASESMQYAFDGQNVEGRTENSAFTGQLIEGLRSGRADADKDGLIGIDELYQYAYRNVIPRQTPSISSTAQTGQLFIALNPNPTIEPGQLPKDLTIAMASENRVFRLGAVSELARLLKTGEPAMVMAAEAAIRKMVADDSRAVSEAAQEALNEHYGLRLPKSEAGRAAQPGAARAREAKVDDTAPRAVTEVQVEEPAEAKEAEAAPAPVGEARPGVERAKEEGLPAVARKWSWGAFWLTFIWGTKHKAWITWLFLFPLLAPVPQLLVGIYSGRKGRQWAWERLEWESEEQYDRVQGKWSFFGFVLGWVVWLVVIGIGAAMTYG